MLDPGSQTQHRSKRPLLVGITILAVSLFAILFQLFWSKALAKIQAEGAASLSAESQAKLWPISIDYPENGSIFPPGITPPTFLWRDGLAAYWTIDTAFLDGTSPIHILSKGERMHIGAIDPECVSATNELPKLTAQQAASWTWTPDAVTWRTIQSHSTGASATTCYLRNIDRDYDAFNEVRTAFYLSQGLDPLPASTGILCRTELLVEIEAMATFQSNEAKS